MNVAIQDNVRLRDQGADPRIILVSDEVVERARETHRIKADIALASRLHTDDALAYLRVAADRLRERSMRAGIRSVLLGLWSQHGVAFHEHVKASKG
jgi:hypothetical protein